MDKFKGSMFLFIAFVLAGTSVVSARFVSGILGNFTITAISLLFAVAGLLPFCIKRFLNDIKQLGKGDWAIIVLQAFFGIFLFRMFLLWGLLHTGSGEAGILTGVTPAVTVILARVVLKETLCKENVFGIISTVAGIMILQGILLPGGSFSLEHLYGNILVVCGGISESIFNIIARAYSLKRVSINDKNLHPITQATLISIIAFLFCLVPSLMEKEMISISKLCFYQWLSLVWYGLVVTGVGFIFWYGGVNRSSATKVAAYSGLMPFTALILSFTILKESVGLEQWCGGILIALGIIIIGRKQGDSI